MSMTFSLGFWVSRNKGIFLFISESLLKETRKFNEMLIEQISVQILLSKIK